MSGRGSRAGARCRGLRRRGRRCSGRGEGFSCRCSRRRRRGEYRAGVAWPGASVAWRGASVVRRGRSGGGRSRVWVGVPVGGCATGTAAPTTVSSAAAAQMIWPRRRKLATMRRRSATMERDYRPGAMAVDYHPAKGGAGCPARPSLLPKADRDCDRAERSIWISPTAGGGPMSSIESRSRRRAAARSQPGRRKPSYITWSALARGFGRRGRHRPLTGWRRTPRVRRGPAASGWQCARAAPCPATRLPLRRS